MLNKKDKKNEGKKNKVMKENTKKKRRGRFKGNPNC